MKTCPNCLVVHPDEYGGQCQECGAPLGGVAANGGNSLGFAFAQQIQEGVTETAQETRMRRGDYSGVKVRNEIMDVARSFIVFDQEKYLKNGGRLEDL